MTKKLTKAKDWYKVRGTAVVTDGVHESIEEVHGYQCKDIGKVEYKKSFRRRVMIMILRYIGDGKKVSFINGKAYSAKKICDKFGEGYAIFDEGDEWYRYGIQFVEKNFDIPAEKELRNEITSEPIMKFA